MNEGDGPHYTGVTCVDLNKDTRYNITIWDIWGCIMQISKNTKDIVLIGSSVCEKAINV